MPVQAHPVSVGMSVPVLRSLQSVCLNVLSIALSVPAPCLSAPRAPSPPHQEVSRIAPKVTAGIPQVMPRLVHQWAAGRLGSRLGGSPVRVRGKLKSRASFVVKSKTNFGDRKGTALDLQAADLYVQNIPVFGLCAFSFRGMITAALYCTWEGSLSAVKQFPEACSDCPKAQLAPLCHIHQSGGSGCVSSGNKCGGLVLAGAFTVTF